MKTIVDRLGIAAILGVIAPGLILLGGAGLWFNPVSQHWLGKGVGSEPVVVGLFTAIIAYAAGLILRWWTLSGGERFIHTQRLLALHFRGVSRLTWLKLTYHGLAFFVLCIFHWMPGLGRRPRAVIKRMMKVSEVLSSFETIERPSAHPLEILHTYRLYIPNYIQDRRDRVLEEADLMHRRLLFIYGLAGAFLAVGGSAAAKLLFEYNAEGSTVNQLSNATLVVITGSAFCGNILLRLSAGRLWKTEIALTLSLVEY